MSDFILAIDQGTTGTTALVVDAEGKLRGKANCEFPQHYPQPGWVEHDALEIWQSVATAVQEALVSAGVTASQCRALGLTNQRETTVLWDRTTGDALHRAIVWQDRRTADRCAALKAQGHETLFRDRTGLVLDPYFSGTKLGWLLDHVPDARRRAESGALAFGTIDSWLLSKLTGGREHKTDITNASRTLMLRLDTLRWDPELLALLNIPERLLPSVYACVDDFGHTQGVGFLPDGVPITGIAGDQHAALFGQTCFELGDAKCTYGTGAFVLMNTGERRVKSTAGLLTTPAWQLRGEAPVFALEGSAFIAGAAVQWLRDGLGIVAHSGEIEALAASVPDCGGVSFVPALTGLGAPYWRPEARGVIAGLTRGTTAAHLARATLEGIALQVTDLVTAMARDAGSPVKRLRVDGGGSANGLLMQFQADMVGVPSHRPRITETTGMGAAYLAGLGAGFFKDLGDITSAYDIDTEFVPHMGEAARKARLAEWQTSIARVLISASES